MRQGTYSRTPVLGERIIETPIWPESAICNVSKTCSVLPVFKELPMHPQDARCTLLGRNNCKDHRACTPVALKTLLQEFPPPPHSNDKKKLTILMVKLQELIFFTKLNHSASKIPFWGGLKVIHAICRADNSEYP